MEQQKYFIIEEAYVPPEKPTIIKDEKIGNNKYKLIFKTILQEADVVNNNRRIYPKDVLQKVVYELQPKAKNRELLCELDHPWITSNDPQLLKKRASQIRLSDVCVIIRDIEFDGKYVTAVCETLTNSKGLDVYALIKDNVNIGFSLRAFGSVKPDLNGNIVVQKDIKPITYDVVSNPSHSTARILEFLSEDINLFVSEAASKEEFQLLSESTDVDIEDINTSKIIIPMGVVVNNLSEEELKQLQEDDNIDIESYSLYIDTNKNIAKICNNNVCVVKPLSEFVKNAIDNEIKGNILKMINVFNAVDNYKPFLSPDISSIEPDIDDNIDMDMDDDETIDNNCMAAIDTALEQSIYETFNSKELEELLKEDNTKVDTFFDKLYESVSEKLGDIKFNKSIDYIEEDYALYENDEDTNIVQESTIEYNDNINDEILAENEYNYKYNTLEEIYAAIDSLYQLTLEENKLEEFILSNFKKEFDNIIEELNSIPSILQDLILEDSKYEEYIDINTILESTDEKSADILFNNLILNEEFSEISNTLKDKLNNQLIECVALDTIYFDMANNNNR